MWKVKIVPDVKDSLPKLNKFGDIMFSVQKPSPPPPHAKAYAWHNCDTNAHIKFIFDTAIDDPEWKNPIDLGNNRKNMRIGLKMAVGGCLENILIKNKAVYWSDMDRNAIESDFF